MTTIPSNTTFGGKKQKHLTGSTLPRQRIEFDTAPVIMGDQPIIVRKARDVGGNDEDISTIPLIFDVRPGAVLWGWYAYVVGDGEVTHLVRYTERFPDQPATSPGKTKAGKPALWHPGAYAQVRVGDDPNTYAAFFIDSDENVLAAIAALHEQGAKLNAKALVVAYTGATQNADKSFTPTFDIKKVLPL